MAKPGAQKRKKEPCASESRRKKPRLAASERLARDQAEGTLESAPPRRSTRGKKHEYSPLAESFIRLLRLVPGAYEEPLRGTLELVSLEDAMNGKVAYEAISYAWGPPHFPHSIQLEAGSVRLTQSSFEALKRFRLEDRDRLLWADALCINQHDPKERSNKSGRWASSTSQRSAS